MVASVPIAAPVQEKSKTSIPVPSKRNLALSLAGGLLAGMAFPNPLAPSMDWPGGFLAFVCLIPLLAVRDPQGIKSTWRWGFFFGLAFYGVNLLWIAQMPALHWMAPLAWLLLIGYLALFPMAFFLVYRALAQRGVPEWFGIPVVWLALEYFRNYSLTGFPWAVLGSSQFRNAWMMAMAPVAGVWGMTFVTALVNALIWIGVKRWLPGQPAEREPRQGITGVRIAIFGLFLAILTVGAVHERKNLQSDPGGEPVTVAGLQGNISQDQTWDRAYQSRVLGVYESLLRRAMAEKARLLVWPETAFPGIFNYDHALAGEIRYWSRQWQVSQMVGADEVEPAGDGTYHYFNSLILIDAQGNRAGVTSKKHLVPFGEYVPFKNSLLYFIDKLVRRYGGAGFMPGKERHLLRWRPGEREIPVAALICFESIFPQYAAQLTAQGSQMLVMVTYDTWFGQTAAPVQHALFSALRAAENARYLLRVGATGISCLFDPQGRLVASVPLNQEGILLGKIRPRTALTLYTRWRDWLPWICMALLAIDLLGIGLRQRGVTP